MFQGRKLLIATKHEKEKVIAPILEKELGVFCFVVPDFDTDQLGTFSGEVERKDDPITTARKKCLLAMELANCDLAVASEGSFGPHPAMVFVPADDEFLLFMDRKNNLEIIERELSTETNFHGTKVKTEAELNDFIQLVKFPTHGLIIKKAKNDFTDTAKGIISRDHLDRVFNYFISKHGEAFIETDMRAMHNPTRMKVIERAAQKLADKIASRCPNCDAPGFGITGSNQGLQCSWCKFPTRSTLSHIYACQKCNHTEEKMFPNGKLWEDPMYCDVCNP